MDLITILKLVLFLLNLGAILLAFSEFLGKETLRKFEALIKVYFSLTGMMMLPLHFFRKLIERKGRVDLIFYFWCLLLILPPLIDKPILGTVRNACLTYFASITSVAVFIHTNVFEPLMKFSFVIGTMLLFTYFFIYLMIFVLLNTYLIIFASYEVIIGKDALGVPLNPSRKALFISL